MDDKKMEAAFNRLLDKIEANAAKAEESLKYSQAALNLAQARLTWGSTKKS